MSFQNIIPNPCPISQRTVQQRVCTFGFMCVALLFFATIPSSGQDLCQSTPSFVVVDYYNDNVQLHFDETRCIELEIISPCACSVPPCSCSVVLIETSTQTVVHRIDYACDQPPNDVVELCVGPGDFTLIIDTCEGGQARLSCKAGCICQ